MGRDDALDRLDDLGRELLGPFGNLVPAGVLGRPQLLDGDVAEGVPVELRQPVVDGHGESKLRSEGRGGLASPTHRARPEGIDTLLSEPRRERGGLSVAERGERRVGGSIAAPFVHAQWQCMSDEEQLHGRVLLCPVVAGLFVSEHQPDGPAPTVVFVHGSLDRSAAFVRVQRHLDDLRIVRYDRRGYGRSLHVGPAPAFTTQVDDLVDVVGGRPAVLMGHSLGGVIALAFAQRHPELARAVVAYEAPMAWMPWWPQATAGSVAIAADGDAAQAAEQFMRRMIGDERWEALPQRTRDQRRAEGPALVAELLSIRNAVAPPYEPSEVRSPVVAAHGTASSDHHKQTATVLAGLVPDGELVVVEDAGHPVHLTHPAALAGLVRRALERVRD